MINGQSKPIIIKKCYFSGFKKAHITEAVNEAHSPIKAGESPFEEMQISL